MARPALGSLSPFHPGTDRRSDPIGHALTWENARNKLHDAIDRALPGRRELDSWVRTLTEAAVDANVLTPIVAQVINIALPSLVRAIERRPLRRAGNWHTDMPEAEDAASALDALVMLNRQAHAHPADMVAWLTAAFLADVRESHLRMSAADVYSSCDCDDPDGKPHLHNWVLLLDDLDCPGGHEFVADLLAARDRHLRQHPGDHDALVVIATSGRWHPEWETGWLPPWKSPEGQSERAHVVPRCRNADYDHWAELVDPHRRPHPSYPVLLEPLDFVETATSPGPPANLSARHPAATDVREDARTDGKTGLHTANWWHDLAPQPGVIPRQGRTFTARLPNRPTCPALAEAAIDPPASFSER